MSRRGSMDALQVAQTIEDFLAGTSGRWDWDDFMFLSIGDPRLDAIRERCARLPDEFPHPQHYCSDAGLDVLREIVQQLRRDSVDT